MPDPAAINPLGKQLRERMYRLNDLIREESAAYGVLAPWLGKGIRGIRLSRNVSPKRPVPTVVPRSAELGDDSGETSTG